MNVYNNFDAIFCITLENQRIRHKHILKIQKKFNIPFEFYISKRNKKSGIVGCFQSHIEVCKIAYKRDCTNVLIFEDDFIPTPGYNTRIIHNIIEYMKINNDWDIIKLGYIECNNNTDILGPIKFLFSTQETKNLVKYYGACTHAYILSRKMMKTMIDYSKFELSKPTNEIDHIDMWLDNLINKLDLKSNCVIPLQFDQKWSFPTTNSTKGLIDNIIRKNQYIAEKTKIVYYLSLIRLYREYILLIFLIIFIVSKKKF